MYVCMHQSFLGKSWISAKPVLVAACSTPAADLLHATLPRSPTLAPISPCMHGISVSEPCYTFSNQFSFNRFNQLYYMYTLYQLTHTLL